MTRFPDIQWNQGARRVLILFASLSQIVCGSGNARSPVSPSGTVALLETEWSLVQLDGEPAGAGTAGVAPTLLLAADGRASGFAGCNRLVATYDAAADRLSLRQIATTRMFCAESMDLERRYLAALEATRTFRLIGRDLQLLGDDGIVARFQAS